MINIESEENNWADISTDFDETMIKEKSPYKIAVASFRYALEQSCATKFLKNLIKNYARYRITRDVSAFYSLLEGCPVTILNKCAEKLHPNEKWIKLIEELKPEKVGIVSRNSHELISMCLKKLEMKLPFPIEIVAANEPEIIDGVYTGRVNLKVDNGKGLADRVKEKEYICGQEEKSNLEKMGFHCLKAKPGLYICSNHRIF